MALKRIKTNEEMVKLTYRKKYSERKRVNKDYMVGHLERL
jgi:hypothetical protein